MWKSSSNKYALLTVRINSHLEACRNSFRQNQPKFRSTCLWEAFCSMTSLSASHFCHVLTQMWGTYRRLRTVKRFFDTVPQQFNYLLQCCLSYTKLNELDGMQDFSFNLYECKWTGIKLLRNFTLHHTVIRSTWAGVLSHGTASCLSDCWTGSFSTLPPFPISKEFKALQSTYLPLHSVFKEEVTWSENSISGKPFLLHFTFVSVGYLPRT